MLKEKPEGPHCYITRVFAEGTTCPDLDDSNTMKPDCLKYRELLAWTRSGIVLKCQKCLAEESN